MDKEYIVLEQVYENENTTQRQLAKKTGLALGSINFLINKMIREGLIKTKSINANRVIYMLTPKGMIEKANKTYRYIRHHYQEIENTKQKIKTIFSIELEKQQKIYVFLDKDKVEISSLIRLSISEINHGGKIQIIDQNDKIDDYNVLKKDICFVVSREQQKILLNEGIETLFWGDVL